MKNCKFVFISVFILISIVSFRTQIKQFLVLGARHLAKQNVTVCIEPLAPRANYYLRSYDLALKLVQELKEPNLKIMYDSFHCQKLHGNLSHYLELVRDHIGHVQVSQTPFRDSPMNDGEVNHDYLLKKISKVYDDYIGLEYFSKFFVLLESFLNDLRSFS